jgi:septum formation protein
MDLPLILASQSPTRVEILKKLYITPDSILPADIDEDELKAELPRKLALRLATEKALAVSAQISEGIILAADTVVAKGRRILPKALTDEQVKHCLQTLSGSRHRVYTGLCVIKKDNNINEIIRTKIVNCIVKFKRLSQQDIEFYIATSEGINKAGGYGIFGLAEAFVLEVMGSYSTVAGLPMLETRNLLMSVGFDKFNIRK